MTPSDERKYLTGVLKDLDEPVKDFPTIWWVCGALLLAAFIFFLFVFRAGTALPPIGIALIAFFFGAAVGAASIAVRATDNWPTIRRHLSKESIRARINELGA